MKRYICLICGYIHVGEAPPANCPICDAPASQFELMKEASSPKRNNGYKCLNCDYTHEGATPPSICPVCGMGSDSFEAIELGEGVYATTDIEKVLILGSGIGGLSAAEKLRQMNPKIEITMVTNEEKLPYYRLNLTRYLGNEVDEGSLCIHTQYWYDEQRIQILKNRVIIDIDKEKKLVQTADGMSLPYDRLIIALGAHPFIPPIEGISLPGIHCLRSMEEAKDLHERIEKGSSVLVIGGGVLGLEAAGAMAKLGAKVMVAEGSSWLMPRQLNRQASDYVAKSLKEIDIDVSYDFKTTKVEKSAKGYTVYTADQRVIETDMIVLATGVRPNTYLMRKAGLEVNQGLVVDDFMTTSDPHIYGVGDVTEHYGVAYGLWNIAQFQGSIAAMNLLGVQTPFGGVPRSNALKVLNVALFSIGEIVASDGSYVELEASGTSDYLRFLIRDQMVVGAIAIGYGDSHHKIKKLVESKQHLVPSQCSSVEAILKVIQ